MTIDSSTAAQGDVGGGVGGSGTSYSQRGSLPWAQVVRGGGEPDSVAPRSQSASPSKEHNLAVSDQLTVMEPKTEATEAAESVPEVGEVSNNDNAIGVKKSPWNKPSANGGGDGSNTPVMGAASWPALSELTRPSPKSLSFSSESSSKSTSDGSVTVTQTSVISQPPLQKPVKTNTSHHSNQNHAHNARQRPIKRGAGTGGSYNRPQPPPPLPPPMPPYPLFDMSYGGFVPAMLDSPVREQAPYNGNNFVPRPANPVHDHALNRKRNNFGPRPGGDGGSYVNNGHGGRRDHHDRDWRAPPRSHGVVPPHQGAPPIPPPPPRGYMPPPHLGPAPFIAPQPLRPFGVPMGYDMAPPPPFVYVPTLPPEPYRGTPLLSHAAPSPAFVPVMDSPLSVLILKQIEYYFSDDNLVKDNYLRSNMDEDGWVSVTLIAGFRRVQNLTSDIQLILNSLTDSTVVEVQGETIRRRNDWRKWVKPSANNLLDSNNQSAHVRSDDSTIDASLQKLTLDESTIMIPTTKEH